MRPEEYPGLEKWLKQFPREKYQQVWSTNGVQIWEKEKESDLDVIYHPTRHIGKRWRYKILSRQHWRCNICGCRLRYSKKSNHPGEVAHIDHIFPASKWKEYDGDVDMPKNLQALCPKCNLEKGDKI